MIPTFRETLRKLVPVLPAERIKRLYSAYLAADGIEKREIENLIEAYAARLLNDNPAQAPAGLFPPPPPETCLGDIDLGKVLYGGRGMCLFGLESRGWTMDDDERRYGSWDVQMEMAEERARRRKTGCACGYPDWPGSCPGTANCPVANYGEEDEP